MNDFKVNDKVQLQGVVTSIDAEDDYWPYEIEFPSYASAWFQECDIDQMEDKNEDRDFIELSNGTVLRLSSVTYVSKVSPSRYGGYYYNITCTGKVGVWLEHDSEDESNADRAALINKLTGD